MQINSFFSADKSIINETLSAIMTDIEFVFN